MHQLKNMTLEVSLKPFRQTDPAYVEAVCKEIFTQWRPLVKDAATVSVLLWTSDGSELLDYDGCPDTPFEWAYWVGNANATPATHRVIADLLEINDFDAADINHRLFGIKSYKLLQAEKVGFDRLRLYADGKVGIVDMPFDVMEAYGFTDDHLGTLVDIARGLQGVQVAAAIRQSGKEGVYRVSVRSSCHVDVAAVCAEFGGGGHIKAAGCTITCGGGIEAVVDMIAKALVAAF